MPMLLLLCCCFAMWELDSFVLIVENFFVLIVEKFLGFRLVCGEIFRFSKYKLGGAGKCLGFQQNKLGLRRNFQVFKNYLG